MTDFAAARRMMVDGQVRTSDVTDLRVIGAMLDLPRERFVPAGKSGLSYLDLDIPVTDVKPGAPARYLLKPMVLAKLVQAAEISEGERVLDVGCASGYSAALLGRLAGSVVALEEEAGLARTAEANLATVGARNVSVTIGTLAAGWSAAAPYDAIVLEGASEVVPKALLAQLKVGGRLVGVVGRAPTTKAMLYRATAQEASGRPIFDAAAPLLPGFAQPPVFVF